MFVEVSFLRHEGFDPNDTVTKHRLAHAHIVVLGHVLFNLEPTACIPQHPGTQNFYDREPLHCGVMDRLPVSLRLVCGYLQGFRVNALGEKSFGRLLLQHHRPIKEIIKQANKSARTLDYSITFTSWVSPLQVADVTPVAHLIKLGRNVNCATQGKAIMTNPLWPSYLSVFVKFKPVKLPRKKV